jgi:uncharacterized membrane protein YebE (DUF533 family)
MSFSDIVGQLIQQGMSSASQGRLKHALGEGGLGSLMDNALSGDSINSQSGKQAGGLGGLLGSLFGSSQGGASNAQIGGIGALAGSLLGGGDGAVKGALGGSAMAVLGSLALSALKNWQQGQADNDGTVNKISQTEIDQISAPETAELCLKGMISAAKADGRIQDDEMKRIGGKLEEGGVTAEERQFVLSEMSKPLDLAGLVNEIPNQQVGAQVYAASLMAITIDTESERAYMKQLAAGLDLDHQTVARLHQMVGASAV